MLGRGNPESAVEVHADTHKPCLQYYDDAAGILRSIILSAIAPHRLATAPPQLPAFAPEAGEALGSCVDLPSQESANTAFRMYAETDDGLQER